MNSQEKLEYYRGQANRVWTNARQFITDDAAPPLLSEYMARGWPQQQLGFIPAAAATVAQKYLDYAFLERMSEVLFGRLLMRIQAPNGEIQGFVSRAVVPEDKAKYRFHSLCEDLPTRSLIFGSTTAVQLLSDELWLVEGVGDAFALQSVKVPAVSVLGARLTFEQAAVVAALADKVVICFDADKAGREGAVEAAIQLASFNILPRIVFPEPDTDPEVNVKKSGQWTEFKLGEFIRITAAEKGLNRMIKALVREGDREEFLQSL
jgi:DNA primase